MHCYTVANNIICKLLAQLSPIKISINSAHVVSSRIVFAITIITGATLYAPGALSTSYHPVLTLLRTVLIASMASRAFRSVKTFQVNHQSFLPVTTPIRFNEPPLSEDNGYSTGMRTTPQERQQPSSDEVLIISRNPEMSEFCRSNLIMSQNEAMI